MATNNLDPIKTKLQYLLDHYKEIPDELFKCGVDSWRDDYKEKFEKDPKLNFVWIYDLYNCGDYCGSGERIGIRKSDGQLTYGFTSHCSCNGPWENENEYGEFFTEVMEYNSDKLTKYKDHNLLPSYKEMGVAIDVVMDVWVNDSQTIMANIEKLYDIVKNGAPATDYDPYIQRDDF